MLMSWLHLAVALFLFAAVAFAAGPLIGSVLLAPRSHGGALHDPYECGMQTHGVAWVSFGINYYFYALLFLAFDVDVLYLFPVAAAYPTLDGVIPVMEVLAFLLVLAMAVVYFWRKGVFTWPRRII